MVIFWEIIASFYRIRVLFADVTIESNGTAEYITSRIKHSKFGFTYSRVNYANELSKNSIGSHKCANLRYEIGGVYIDEA